MNVAGRSLAVAGALAVLGILSACTGSDDDRTAPTPTPTSSEPPTSAATPTPGSAAYLPTPDGVVLTAPGTELEFRDAAVVAWTPRQGLVGVVDLKVRDLQQTTFGDAFAGYDLGEVASRSTPYFLRLRVENVGVTDLGQRQLPLYLLDSRGRLIEPSDVQGRDGGTFTPCPDALLPAIFAPGSDTRSCLVFVVPSGASVEAVMFRPPEGVVPLTWTGEPRRYRPRPTPESTPTPTDEPTD